MMRKGSPRLPSFTKKLVALLLTLLVTASFAAPALADGIIIIEPPMPPVPPDPQPGPWLTIEYHRVEVTVEDQVATTHVDQLFRNEGDFEAEGTYVFPLPPGAVVRDFAMWVDGERLEAEILPADEARRIYESYVSRRRDPALLEYVGREAVRARIYPIPPGGERRVQLEYHQLLPIEGGLMHYRYPLNTERFSAAPLEQVSVHVTVRAEEEIHALYSPTHQDEVVIQRPSEREGEVSYEASDLYPERDFELYVGFGAEEIGANALTYDPPGEDGFFLLMLSPGLENGDRVVPKDVLLVLDTSGSMEGDKLSQAKEALRYVLDHLNPEDRFNVIAYSSDVRPYAPDLRPPGEAGAAAEWVSDLEALGGTNIYLALAEALGQAGTERPTVVIFLTDGLPTEGLTEEEPLLAALRDEAPPSTRVFPFGVGYDVNTLLLDRLAQEHRGRPAYVEPEERIDEVVSAFYARVQSPVLTDLELDLGDVTAYDFYPNPLPDLFAGTQLIVTGRYAGPEPRIVRLSGDVKGERRTFTYEPFAGQGDTDFIPRLWAARKIGHLLTQIRLHGEEEEWVDAVVELSLRYGIITPYTSFLVEEEDVLTTEGRQEAADELMEAEAPAASGFDAVQEAESRLGLGGAEAPPAAAELPADEATGRPTTAVRHVGPKTFLCREGVCTDTVFVPDRMEAHEVAFGSEAYWALVAEHPEWGRYLALSDEVTFVTEEGAYRVVPAAEGEFVDPPQPTEETAATAPPPVDPTSEPPDDDAGPPPASPCAGALLLPLVIAVGVAGRRRRRS
jgi:Ca-activated chloride channel family protein